MSMNSHSSLGDDARCQIEEKEPSTSHAVSVDIFVHHESSLLCQMHL